MIWTGVDDDPEAERYRDQAAFAVTHTVLAVVVGEPACGLADPELAEQARRRAVFAPPTELFWRFDKPPAEVSGPGLDRVSWEVEPFCAAALRGEPDALEVLGSPLVESCTPIGAELRELTTAFLSQRIADAYRRATATEFARASAAMAAKGTPRWGQLAEVIRQLIVVERTLRTGRLDIDVSAHAQQLLAVAAGTLPWPETRSWVESLRDRSAEAVLRSPLPAVPNLPAVRNWLMSVRRRLITP